jgi:hypothetical protein
MLFKGATERQNPQKRTEATRMAGIEFQFSSRDLIALRKWYKKSPRQFAASTGMLLNNMAFGSRLESLGLIHARMLIRSPGFVRSRVQVKKSHFRLPMESQVSEMGSVKKPRFSGWVEQELGSRGARKHFASISGRAGNKRGKIKRGARLDKPFVNPKRYPKRRGFRGKNFDHRIQVMLSTLERMNYSKPFVIFGHTRIPSGLYKFGRGKTGFGQRQIDALQLFYKPKVTKRVRWMSGGVKRYFKSTNIKREWGKVVERMLRRQGPR